MSDFEAATLHYLQDVLAEMRVALSGPGEKLEVWQLVERCKRLKAREQAAVRLLVEVCERCPTSPSEFYVPGFGEVYSSRTHAVEAAIAEEMKNNNA